MKALTPIVKSYSDCAGGKISRLGEAEQLPHDERMHGVASTRTAGVCQEL